VISSAAQLAELLPKIAAVGRVGIDTEADSLHCFREKLCLLQISVRSMGLSESDDRIRVAPSLESTSPSPDYGVPRENAIHRGQNIVSDFIVDPLAEIDLAPLTSLLATKEIVLHGADFDLRLLRRCLDLVPKQIFDTVIAARLTGIREFSLVALVERYFGIQLTKGSQRANWARRPLPQRMEEYAMNDTHYLLPLADHLKVELDWQGRFEWFQQSCRRALEQSAVSRSRDADEAWRIPGAGTLQGRAAAVLRQLWRWREDEAEAANRPPFHILQNRELLSAAESFANGKVSDYKHFSARRRQAFREAAEYALNLPEKDWPVLRRRSRERPSLEIVRRVQELKQRRDHAAKKHDLEPSFIASRGAIESIAVDESRAETLLVPWQQQLLGLASTK
jgi:ribonuclease D